MGVEAEAFNLWKKFTVVNTTEKDYERVSNSNMQWREKYKLEK